MEVSDLAPCLDIAAASGSNDDICCDHCSGGEGSNCYRKDWFSRNGSEFKPLFFCMHVRGVAASFDLHSAASHVFFGILEIGAAVVGLGEKTAGCLTFKDSEKVTKC